MGYWSYILMVVCGIAFWKTNGVVAGCTLLQAQSEGPASGAFVALSFIADVAANLLNNILTSIPITHNLLGTLNLAPNPP